MPDAQDGAPDSAAVKQAQLVRQKRFAVDLQQSLGDLLREFAQARGQSTRENRHRKRILFHLKVDFNRRLARPATINPSRPPVRFAAGLKAMEIDTEIAAVIDHTLLRPEATAAEIRRLCEQARLYRFASVCVHPCWVELASAEVAGSGVKVCTVAGFPLGANATGVKAAEAETAARAGAREIDMVINIGELKGG